MTAPMANREPRYQPSPTPLTNGKKVTVAEVHQAVAARLPGGRGSETLGLKRLLERSLLALPAPPTDPQATARSSPAGSGVCPAGKAVHRSRH